jgi:rod shape-determining protein MreD
MNLTIWQKCNRLARSLIPFVSSMMLVILSVVPLYIPSYEQMSPIFVLISIYHWAIYRPDLLPLYSIFILGLTQDFLNGTPVGLFVVVFLSIYGLIVSQRRFFAGKSFNLYWFGFAAILLFAFFLSWALASIWHLTLLNFKSMFFEFLLLVGILPVVSRALFGWQQAYLQQD